MRILEKFETANKVNFVNRLIQVCLILSLLGGLNYLSIRYFDRVDLTENHRFALSAESVAYIKQLREPVDIIVTLPADTSNEEEIALLRYLRILLREYSMAGQINGESRIRVEFVDIFRDRARALEIAQRYGIDDTRSILVNYQDRRRLLQLDEFVEFDGDRITAYTGESALTSAIVEVHQERTPVIYFLTGHGEDRLDDTRPRIGLSALSKVIRSRNMLPRAIDLNAVDGVPEDAGIIVIANPKGPLSSGEVEKIRHYLEDQSGRVLIWLNANDSHGLETLLPQWGISLPDKVIVEADKAFLDSSGNILIRNFADHPVTRSLIENQTSLVVGDCRPVLPIQPNPADERMEIIPLFATSSSSWGENRLSFSANPTFDPLLDTTGPLPVAVASQQTASSQLGINIPGGKLVILGTADVFTNQYLVNIGNSTLLFGILNWMLERNQLIAIPPRPATTYKIQLSESELKKIGLIFICVPFGVAVCGFIVFWTRKY
jgi:hypothetical protein